MTATITRADLAAILAEECPHRGFLAEDGVLRKDKFYCKLKHERVCNAELLADNCPTDCPRLKNRDIICDGAACRSIKRKADYYIKLKNQ